MSIPLPDGLARLAFANRATRALPADPSGERRPRQVHGAAFSRVEPAPAPDPRVLAVSREVAESLGLSADDWTAPAFAAVFGGSRLLPGSDPHASAYGGHQFGHWAGQLGDGRAITLGEVRCPDGVHRTLQLKGAGPTPYARSGDGYAVLRSSVREFLCSEAMHHLGVPTTRALCLVTTGREVLRDMFYDGNPAHEPGAVVTRVAESFTRFGTFELPALRGEPELLRALVRFTLDEELPEAAGCAPHGDGPDAPLDEARIVRMYAEVCRRTAALVVDWQRVGFVHGVLNTDNMSILGQTIDYGPYGWLERYDPDWTRSTPDATGRRYRFGDQPAVAHWNLLQLGRALAPLVEDVGALQAAVDAYPAAFEDGWREALCAKLGLRTWRGEEDDRLAVELFELLQATETDMTLFFRGLGRVARDEPADGADEPVPAPLRAAYYDPAAPSASVAARTRAWLARWRARVRAEGTPDGARRAAMDAVNPRFVLRNYLDGGVAVRELLDVLRRPYDEQPGRERYAAKRPEWARHRAGCSMLSCSS